MPKECLIHGDRHADYDCEAGQNTIELLSLELEHRLMHIGRLVISSPEEATMWLHAFMGALHERIGEVSLSVLGRAFRVLDEGNKEALEVQRTARVDADNPLDVVRGRLRRAERQLQNTGELVKFLEKEMKMRRKRRSGMSQIFQGLFHHQEA